MFDLARKTIAAKGTLETVHIEVVFVSGVELLYDNIIASLNEGETPTLYPHLSPQKLTRSCAN